MADVLLALGPVLLFLGALMALDSFQLVGLRSVLGAIVAGCAAAVAALVSSDALLAWLAVDLRTYARYGAPVVEEIAKALYLVWLLRRERIGFLVDAGIYGFAIGAGFAFAENMHYLVFAPRSSLLLWMVRGFGTALMHGGLTAMVAALARSRLERAGARIDLALLPGLALAVLLHSLFNHFLLRPEYTTLVVLVVLPTVVLLVFRRSEAEIRAWLGPGFDADRDLLGMITSGTLTETPVGRYLETLRSRFPPSVVADMLCLLRLQAELSIRAKGLLLMREAGFDLPPDAEAGEQLREMSYLRRQIGATGLLALRPFVRGAGRERWQLTVLDPRRRVI